MGDISLEKLQTMRMIRIQAWNVRSIEGRLAVIAMAFAIVTIGGRTASGQQPAEPNKAEGQPPTAQTHPNNPELWNTEQMMSDAVLQISRRYNLNKQQEDFTRLLLVKRVTDFLQKYEPEVRELLKESIDLRLGKKAGTPEAYAKWAIRAAPIYAEAQDAILKGNEEWRVILTDEQKKIHDSDLSQMRANFQNVDRMLEGWKNGKGPNLPAMAGAQGGGVVGGPGGVSPPLAIAQRQVEDNWLAYVNRFIKTYKLDDKQTISARDKIYKDIRDEVTKYREKRKAEFAKLDSEAASPKNKPADFERRRIELEKPIQERFVLLDSRLRQLVDSKQMAEANPDEKRQLDAWFKMLSGQSGDKAHKSEAKGTSQPAHPVSAQDKPAAKPLSGNKPDAPAISSQPAASKVGGP
jgi:hypothetical protein